MRVTFLLTVLLRNSHEANAFFLQSTGQLAREQVQVMGRVSASWKEDDDWSRLSRTENDQTVPSPGEDVVESAAKSFEEDAQSWLDSAGAPSPEEELVEEMVEIIHSVIRDDGSHHLYDYPGELSTFTMEDEMGREISMLIRCNESPAELLIDQGRALPPLTEKERFELSQIVNLETCEPTVFFRNAIAVMFHEHSIEVKTDKDQRIMKAPQVASWMSKSLGTHVSAHDKRVISTISRFSEYGTGYLNAENFNELYGLALDAAIDGSHVQIGRKMGIKGQPTIETIWTDIRNHNILSPVEAEREIKLLEMRNRSGEEEAISTSGFVSKVDMMDECEILDDGQFYATTTSQTPWSSVKQNEKSSYELVETASDGKTPLYLRDGDFIFIDEESCIGCTQCTMSAPSSFLMLDNGRARTFLQLNNPDVAAAVSTCPVSCMHRVSFDELVQLETTREKGDGRTDHRHVGVCKPPTPLHIARRGTDANHKSSWYHYLKQKCFLSSDCPKRGCYACPNYNSPGDNPYWKIKHQQAEHVRASTFVQLGVADKYRKAVDL